MASLCDSARRAVSSSVAGLWLVKQSTLHRMGYRANGYEGKGTCKRLVVRGQGSTVLTGPSSVRLSPSVELFFGGGAVACLQNPFHFSPAFFSLVSLCRRMQSSGIEQICVKGCLNSSAEGSFAPCVSV